MVGRRQSGSRPRFGLVPVAAGGPEASGPTLVPTGERTTEELLELVATGDEASFEMLYDRVAGVVFGLAKAVLRDPHQSEEVAQEVLLEVWRTAPRFDATKGSAKAWISTMAHRRAVDRVRSSQASRNRDEAVAAGQGVRDYDDVVEQVERQLDVERVRHCLDGLTPRQREAVTLAYYGGHSYADVAVLLKLPLGTVKTRMRDGLIRLRDCLGWVLLPDLHLLTGAYALDALEHPERADFERHLHTCPTCRVELGDFAEAAASLADRVAVPPPPELRERVLREVARTRQASPTGRVPLRHPVLRRGLLSAAAAVLIAVSAGSVGVAWQDHRAAGRANVAASRVAERAAQVSAVLSDPARTEIVQPATRGGTATVVTAGDKAVLITSRLPDPPPGKTYQVWLFDKNGMRSVELLATRDGYGQSLVSGITAGASVAVSVEPAGGSRQPTTTPVLNVPIA